MAYLSRRIRWTSIKSSSGCHPTDPCCATNGLNHTFIRLFNRIQLGCLNGLIKKGVRYYQHGTRPTRGLKGRDHDKTKSSKSSKSSRYDRNTDTSTSLVDPETLIATKRASELLRRLRNRDMPFKSHENEQLTLILQYASELADRSFSLRVLRLFEAACTTMNNSRSNNIPMCAIIPEQCSLAVQIAADIGDPALTRRCLRHAIQRHISLDPVAYVRSIQVLSSGANSDIGEAAFCLYQLLHVCEVQANDLDILYARSRHALMNAQSDASNRYSTDTTRTDVPFICDASNRQHNSHEQTDAANTPLTDMVPYRLAMPALNALAGAAARSHDIALTCAVLTGMVRLQLPPDPATVGHIVQVGAKRAEQDWSSTFSKLKLSGRAAAHGMNIATKNSAHPTASHSINDQQAITALQRLETPAEAAWRWLSWLHNELMLPIDVLNMNLMLRIASLPDPQYAKILAPSMGPDASKRFAFAPNDLCRRVWTTYRALSGMMQEQSDDFEEMSTCSTYAQQETDELLGPSSSNLLNDNALYENNSKSNDLPFYLEKHTGTDMYGNQETYFRLLRASVLANDHGCMLTCLDLVSTAGITFEPQHFYQLLKDACRRSSPISDTSMRTLLSGLMEHATKAANSSDLEHTSGGTHSNLNAWSSTSIESLLTEALRMCYTAPFHMELAAWTAQGLWALYCTTTVPDEFLLRRTLAAQRCIEASELAVLSGLSQLLSNAANQDKAISTTTTTTESTTSNIAYELVHSLMSGLSTIVAVTTSSESEKSWQHCSTGSSESQKSWQHSSIEPSDTTLVNLIKTHWYQPWQTLTSKISDQPLEDHVLILLDDESAALCHSVWTWAGTAVNCASDRLAYLTPDSTSSIKEEISMQPTGMNYTTDTHDPSGQSYIGTHSMYLSNELSDMLTELDKFVFSHNRRFQQDSASHNTYRKQRASVQDFAMSPSRSSSVRRGLYYHWSIRTQVDLLRFIPSVDELMGSTSTTTTRTPTTTTAATATATNATNATATGATSTATGATERPLDAVTEDSASLNSWKGSKQNETFNTTQLTDTSKTIQPIDTSMTTNHSKCTDTSRTSQPIETSQRQRTNHSNSTGSIDPFQINSKSACILDIQRDTDGLYSFTPVGSHLSASFEKNKEHQTQEVRHSPLLSNKRAIELTTEVEYALQLVARSRSSPADVNSLLSTFVELIYVHQTNLQKSGYNLDSMNTSPVDPMTWLRVAQAADAAGYIQASQWLLQRAIQCGAFQYSLPAVPGISHTVVDNEQDRNEIYSKIDKYGIKQPTMDLETDLNDLFHSLIVPCTAGLSKHERKRRTASIKSQTVPGHNEIKQNSISKNTSCGTIVNDEPNTESSAPQEYLARHTKKLVHMGGASGVFDLTHDIQQVLVLDVSSIYSINHSMYHTKHSDQIIAHSLSSRWKGELLRAYLPLVKQWLCTMYANDVSNKHVCKTNIDTMGLLVHGKPRALGSLSSVLAQPGPSLAPLYHVRLLTQPWLYVSPQQLSNWATHKPLNSTNAEQNGTEQLDLTRQEAPWRRRYLRAIEFARDTIFFSR